MRTRIIALIILIFLIGWPTYFYWYFYKNNISSIVFISESEEPYTISLDGKLEYQYFPLLDEVFRYKSTCKGSCIFKPIPPLSYELHIISDGREDTIDRIELATWEQKKYDVILQEQLFIEKVGTMPFALPSASLDGYIPVGVSSHGKVIAVEDKRDGGEVWVMNNGRFVSLFRSKKSLTNSYIESTRSFLIVPDAASKQALYPLDAVIPWVVFPNSERIITIVYDSNTWKVQTEKNLYELVNGIWKINPRFTDYIDIDSRYRLGYIKKSQSEKLKLQNFSQSNSIMVLLDRTKNTTTLMKKWIEIVGFLRYNEEPAFLDTEWEIYRLEIRGVTE